MKDVIFSGHSNAELTFVPNVSSELTLPDVFSELTLHLM